MHVDAAWIALIGTLFGGAGLKILEHWLGRNAVKADEATKIRGELREEIAALRDENTRIETDLDAVRKEYYDLRDKYATLNSEYLIALEKIRIAAEQVSKTPDKGLDPPATV